MDSSRISHLATPYAQQPTIQLYRPLYRDDPAIYPAQSRTGSRNLRLDRTWVNTKCQKSFIAIFQLQGFGPP